MTIHGIIKSSVTLPDRSKLVGFIQFVEMTGASNPFDGFQAPNLASKPALVDLEGDGDLDAVVGDSYGTILFLENQGTAGSPNFVERTDTANPFNDIDVGHYSTPVFSDLDGDGDLDMLIGEGAGNINCFQNDGTAASPSFIEATGDENPVDGLTVYAGSTPALGDLDDDGDLDLLVGHYSPGYIFFYRGTFDRSAVMAPVNFLLLGE